MLNHVYPGDPLYDMLEKAKRESHSESFVFRGQPWVAENNGGKFSFHRRNTHLPAAEEDTEEFEVFEANEVLEPEEYILDYKGDEQIISPETEYKGDITPKIVYDKDRFPDHNPLPSDISRYPGVDRDNLPYYGESGDAPDEPEQKPKRRRRK